MVEPVVWKEGLFLRPQHFQQNDRYVSYELMTRAKEQQSNGWGFFSLELDTGLLDSGRLAIEKAYGIMPDGSLFQFTAKSLPLSISIDLSDIGKSIHLALPVTFANADAIRYNNDSDQITRYFATQVYDVSNINHGEESKTDMLLARPNFKLMFDDELNEGYISIKIAQAGAISNSGIVSLETYVPTYLHMHAADQLLVHVKDLMNIITYRTEKLAEKISDANLQAAELGDYLLIQLLNRFLGRMHYFVSQDRVHPGELYLELSGLANELAVFMTKERRLLTQTIYQHKQQYESFMSIIKDLKHMLSNVLEQNSMNIPIEKRKYGVLVAKITDKSMIENGVFVLAVTADVESAKLQKMLESNFKIGSIETIRELVNYHLSGFNKKALPVAPRQIPYRSNYSYFKLEINDEEKQNLLSSGGFAFHMSGDIPGFEFNLWAIRRD